MKTKVISFFNSKGGVGKSNLTNIVALQFSKMLSTPSVPLSVLVIDADDQHTLISKREKSVGILTSDLSEISDPVKKMIAQRERKRYSIMQKSIGWLPYTMFNVYSAESEEQAQKEIYSEKYDFVFIDFPGTISQENNSLLYDCLNYVFIPTSYTSSDLDGTIKFINFLLENPPRELYGAHIVFNKYEIQKQGAFNDAEKILSQTGLNILHSRIRAFSSFDNCSLIPITSSVNINKNTIEEATQFVDIDNVTEEILKIISQDER